MAETADVTTESVTDEGKSADNTSESVSKLNNAEIKLEDTIEAVNENLAVANENNTDKSFGIKEKVLNTLLEQKKEKEKKKKVGEQYKKQQKKRSDMRSGKTPFLKGSVFKIM